MYFHSRIRFLRPILPLQVIGYAEVGQKTATRAPMVNTPGRGWGQQRESFRKTSRPFPGRPPEGDPFVSRRDPLLQNVPCKRILDINSLRHSRIFAHNIHLHTLISTRTLEVTCIWLDEIAQLAENRERFHLDLSFCVSLALQVLHESALRITIDLYRVALQLADGARLVAGRKRRKVCHEIPSMGENKTMFEWKMAYKVLSPVFMNVCTYSNWLD